MGEAWHLNQDGGWLPIEDESDHFESMIRHGYKDKLIMSLADVPLALKPEYAEMNEGGFQAYIKERREECRDAYSEMSDLRKFFDDLLTGESFLTIC